MTSIRTPARSCVRPGLVRNGTPINFDRIGRTALASLPPLLRRWLPDGRVEGAEWVALNPRRADHRPGSFKINIRTGRWADFSTGDKGGDVISLAAYLFGLSQAEAAQRIAAMLGISTEEASHG